MAGIPDRFSARLLRYLGGGATRRVARWAIQLGRIEAIEPELKRLDDESLRKESLQLRYEARSGEPLKKLLPRAYALVREAARRRLDMRHYDVQLVGGMGLFERTIAEMQTGEGKTLTATLPMYLHALAGRGAHLITANDYLAQRDAEWMRPVYEALGLTVGVIQQPLREPERRAAYACDVTYGTASEVGFDFLRDRLKLRESGDGDGGLFAPLGGPGSGARTVCREPHFALVDEADSILIDEARTPLVISAPVGEEQRREAACYMWASELSGSLEEKTHFEYHHDDRSVELTAQGRLEVRRAPKPSTLDRVGLVTMYEFVERAVKVRRDYLLDRHYVIRDGEIVIVDEFTGRPAEGRQWRDGIHQAVEAKEGLDVTFATHQAATITVQNLLSRYPHLAGMTGTGSDSARELSRIYKLAVVPIPTNRPPRRKELSTRVFGVTDEKLDAIVAEVRDMVAKGRPVLIGTRSIDKSEALSQRLAAAGIEHQVLNARHLAKEAAIVADAGKRARVTVATNMAGRGTDIKLEPEVETLGGLHVIATERHDSARVDRQLVGRCGRQGDQGSFRFFLALDDDILREGFGPETALSLASVGKRRGRFDSYASTFKKAQARVEKRHFKARRILLHQTREREKMHRAMGQDPYLDAPD